MSLHEILLLFFAFSVRAGNSPCPPLFFRLVLLVELKQDIVDIDAELLKIEIVGRIQHFNFVEAGQPIRLGE